MYQKCCRKCGSHSLFTEQHGNNTGLYCSDCGAWQTWLGKMNLEHFNVHKGEKMLIIHILQTIKKPIQYKQSIVFTAKKHKNVRQLKRCRN